jgi:hypothetical protein
MGIEEAQWPMFLNSLFQRFRPRMIGIHLRQIDAISIYAYQNNPEPFLPVADTKRLIDLLRQKTKAPIVLGGIGFTIQHEKLAHYLQPDFAVKGSPDDFFSSFESILKGEKLNEVNNLIYRENSKYLINKSSFHAPLQEQEYDDYIVNDMIKFYGSRFFNLHSVEATIPIEVSRGCPYRCYFCVEPEIKGKKIQYRDPEVVTSEIEYLYKFHGGHRFFFIASELNITGAEFPLKLAERMVKIREKFNDKNISWTGYMLPTLTKREHFDILLRSGYALNFNEATSFSEENVKKTRVPYKVNDAIAFYKNRQSIMGEDFTLDFFLGNIFADRKTIRETISKAFEAGLNKSERRPTLNFATRFYEPLKSRGIGDVAPNLVVFGKEKYPQSENLNNFILPSFTFPQELLDILQTPDAIQTFFHYIAGTFLSQAHKMEANWIDFLTHNSSVAQLEKFLLEAFDILGAPDIEIEEGAEEQGPIQSIQKIFENMDRKASVTNLIAEHFIVSKNFQQNNQVLYLLLEYIQGANLKKMDPIYRHLNVREIIYNENSFQEFEVAKTLNFTFERIGELYKDVSKKFKLASSSGIEILMLRFLIHRLNVIIKPEYRDLLFEPAKDSIETQGFKKTGSD